jgi:hypothetical protein
LFIVFVIALCCLVIAVLGCCCCSDVGDCRTEWESGELARVLSAPSLLRARLRLTSAMPGSSEREESDDEHLAAVDLESSNSEELLAVAANPLSAPPSPQQTLD